MKIMKKLTVAELQAQLELLKSSKSKSSKPVTETHKSSVAQDIKNSYIQNLHMKSSMFMLWLATAVLSYGSKIPYIRKIITVLSLMYGRTTIWKVLVKLRKIFILFNALIGVYMVFKTVGFGYDNVLAGFVGLGNTYVDIFCNFTKRLFHWFVELFDHKVIPNVPSDNISGGSGNKNIWLPKGIESHSFYPKPYVEDSLRKSYNSLFNINVEPTPISWYKDLSTWLWLGGIICTIGGLYIGYKLIIDPLFVEGLGRDVTGTVDKGKGVATTVTSPEGSITPTGATADAGSIVYKVTKTIVKSFFKPLKYLNPNYWFLTSTENTEEVKAFITQQATTKRLEDFYPYTKVNPYDSWIKRMRLYYLGETTAEIIDRKALALDFLTKATKHIQNTPVSSGSTLQVTPQVASLGLGLTMDPGFAGVAEKIFSVPSTPGLKPITHIMTDEMGNPFEQEVLKSAVGRLKTLPFTDEFDEAELALNKATGVSTYNRFNELEVEYVVSSPD
jgi:hypothetical protein